jgi:hypothetical protein
MTFVHALFFVGGFSLVFVVGWGGAATLAGQLFGQYKTALGKLVGVVVILFGLYTLGVLRIPWLSMDTRAQPGRPTSGGLLNSGLFGVLFAAGWTPCVGTTLGAILTLGFSQATSSQAMVLSSGYALGLGLPSCPGSPAGPRLGIVKVPKYIRTFQRISGLFRCCWGAAPDQQITLIAIWAQQWVLPRLPFNGDRTELSGGHAAPSPSSARVLRWSLPTWRIWVARDWQPRTRPVRKGRPNRPRLQLGLCGPALRTELSPSHTHAANNRHLRLSFVKYGANGARRRRLFGG